MWHTQPSLGTSSFARVSLLSQASPLAALWSNGGTSFSLFPDTNPSSGSDSQPHKTHFVCLFFCSLIIFSSYFTADLATTQLQSITHPSYPPQQLRGENHSKSWLYRPVKVAKGRQICCPVDVSECLLSL